MSNQKADGVSAGLARRIVCCAAKWRVVADCLLLVCASGVHAKELVGTVAKIAGGDALNILVGKEAHWVRRPE
jgi:hypothetical protein